MSSVELKLDWCSHKAAKYAVKTWHYSKRMPSFKKVCIGVWEDSRFVGVVMYGQGATPEFGKRFGLQRTEVCELTRVALGAHQHQTSRIVSISLKMLRKKCPKLRLVISFADTEQGHIGGIYQAGNWLYAGESITHGYLVNGVIVHPKTLHSRYGKGGQSVGWLQENVDPNAKRVIAGVKHRYLMGLDDSTRANIEHLRKPYPKRARSVDSDTVAFQPQSGGAIPTRALKEP